MRSGGVNVRSAYVVTRLYSAFAHAWGFGHFGCSGHSRLGALGPIVPCRAGRPPWWHRRSSHAVHAARPGVAAPPPIAHDRTGQPPPPGGVTVSVTPVPPLDRLGAARVVLARKKKLGLTWDKIAQALGHPVEWSTSALLGQQTLTREQAETAGSLLDLEPDVVDALTLPPVRGASAVDLTDPLVYRLSEMVQVYGTTISELVREEFGDGIVSAIDFELDLQRVPDPKGDRAVITLNGKFLPYRVW
ncbi:cyanase [Pseudonocardia alni]|nr:cyanase [Pseudonocardia alni]